MEILHKNYTYSLAKQSKARLIDSDDKNAKEQSTELRWKKMKKGTRPE